MSDCSSNAFEAPCRACSGIQILGIYENGGEYIEAHINRDGYLIVKAKAGDWKSSGGVRLEYCPQCGRRIGNE